MLPSLMSPIWWSMPALMILWEDWSKRALAMKDLCPLSLQYEWLESEQTMRQFSQGKHSRKDCDPLSKACSLLIGISVSILVFTTRLLARSMTMISSLELRLTTISFLSSRTAKELTSTLKARRAMESSGWAMAVNSSHPQRQTLPSFMILFWSQLRQKSSTFSDQYLVRNLASLPSLSYFCRKMKLPTCQTVARVPREGWSSSLRMGEGKYGWQCSSLPKRAEEALDMKLSAFRDLLYLSFTLHSLSLYSTTISCPDRYPIMNSPCCTATEVFCCLAVSDLMWRVAMSFRGRMPARGMVAGMSLVRSGVKGQRVRDSATLSAASMKCRSWWAWVAERMWKGKPPTLSFLSSHLGISLLYSLSIYQYNGSQQRRSGRTYHAHVHQVAVEHLLRLRNMDRLRRPGWPHHPRPGTHCPRQHPLGGPARDEEQGDLPGVQEGVQQVNTADKGEGDGGERGGGGWGQAPILQ